MSDVKGDIQHTGETGLRQLRNRMLNLWHLLKNIGKRTIRYVIKYYANPINAVKNDGPNKQLSSTPLLTKEEAKYAIVKMNEYGVIATMKEVDIAIDDDGIPLKNENGKEITETVPYKGKTLHSQEKMAKSELKIIKWKDRAIRFEKIGFLKNYAQKRVSHFEELAKQDRISSKRSSQRYIFITNQSNTAVLNDILAEIQTRRIELKNEGLLEDLNHDGLVDEKDITVGQTIDLSSLKLEDLVEGKEFGELSWIQIPPQNACVQIISKEKFIETRQELSSVSTYACKVHDDNHVKLYYGTQYQSNINKVLQEEEPHIIEFGGKSGDTIAKVSPDDSIKTLRFLEQVELNKFKKLMGNQDYIINYENGQYEVQVAESELEEADRIIQVKNQLTHEEENQVLEKDEVKALSSWEEKNDLELTDMDLDELEELEK